MDHLEEEQDRQSLPQQEQPAQRTRRSTRAQPTPPHAPPQDQTQQQQWPQRMQTYPIAAQQSHPYAVAGQRRPYPGSQEMAGNPAASTMHAAGPGRAPEMDYRQQHPGTAAPMNYQMHQTTASAYPAGYPQHYQAPPQQIYHHPSQIGLQQPPPPQQQQPLHIQQPLGVPAHHVQPPPPPPQPFIQPTAGRLPKDRPLIKLSVSLIDTYKQINKVYYEERDARRAARAAQKAQKGQGANNNGWDDENFDYIVTNGERFYGRYIIKERIGKGSFGQVVRAVDSETNKDVAIKIIKSKKPFLMQAKTEIELLSHLVDKDSDDQNNVVRLLTHFIYRNHQCLVFEMLSLNLYELLKNTQFGGVSLNLIRKFAKQILKALSFLARPDVDIIHCDLKPENILLRHPKRSGVKVIDFGSSCRSNKRMYSYIQSRFYRSPEVMLGLPYSVAIDIWSLGCILVEMHTGEPLFSGSDQFDQMQKIVQRLGMLPTPMLEQASDHHRLNFFERVPSDSGGEVWAVKQTSSSSTSARSTPPKTKVVPSEDPIASLAEVIGAEPSRKKKHPPTETGNSPQNYELFVDLVYKMLAYDPKERIKPEEALQHPFIMSSSEQNPAREPPRSIAVSENPAADDTVSPQKKRAAGVSRRTQSQR